MKKPTLYKWDYIVITLGLAFMFLLASSEGISSVMIVPVIALGIAALIYLLKRIFSEKSMYRVESTLMWVKKMADEYGVVIVAIAFLVVIGWFGFKIVIASFFWLKNGSWQFNYEPACGHIIFDCNPSTGFVKIDELISWFYRLDITIFVFLCIFAVILAWFLITSLAKNHE